MKRYLFIIIFFVFFEACQEQQTGKKDVVTTPDTTTYTTIEWLDSLKNIGVVEGGKKTEVKFRFRNSGTRPLLIISATPGCGCTVADYPKEAIASGEEGVITAAYNAPVTIGEFRKNIHVTTNTYGASDHYIYFSGSIRKPGDSTKTRSLDSGTLRSLKSKELTKNLLLKPTKNR